MLLPWLTVWLDSVFESLDHGSSVVWHSENAGHFSPSHAHSFAEDHGAVLRAVPPSCPRRAGGLVKLSHHRCWWFALGHIPPVERVVSSAVLCYFLGSAFAFVGQGAFVLVLQFLAFPLSFRLWNLLFSP